MQLKQWLKKNNMNAREFAEKIQYRSNYIYGISSGRIIPGKKLTNIIYKHTNFEVMASDLGYKEKEKCKCPTCGRIM